MDYVSEGKLKFSIDKVFELDQVAEAHKYIESGKTMGKVLIKI